MKKNKETIIYFRCWRSAAYIFFLLFFLVFITSEEHEETKFGFSFYVVIFPLLIITYAVNVSCYFYCLSNVLSLFFCWHSPNGVLSACDGRLPFPRYNLPRNLTMRCYDVLYAVTTTHQLWMTWKSIFRLFQWVNPASRKNKLRSSMGIFFRVGRALFWGGKFEREILWSENTKRRRRKMIHVKSSSVKVRK